MLLIHHIRLLISKIAVRVKVLRAYHSILVELLLRIHVHVHVVLILAWVRCKVIVHETGRVLALSYIILLIIHVHLFLLLLVHAAHVRLLLRDALHRLRLAVHRLHHRLGVLASHVWSLHHSWSRRLDRSHRRWLRLTSLTASSWTRSRACFLSIHSSSGVWPYYISAISSSATHSWLRHWGKLVAHVFKERI